MLKYTLKDDGTYEVSDFKGDSKNVEIPEEYKGIKVTSIGDFAFKGCSSLTNVIIGNNVTSIGKEAFSGCSGLTSVTIGNSVKSFGPYVFHDCIGLTSIYWNATNCTAAGNYSYTKFSECSKLTTIIIGNNVKSIPGYAFYNCSGLTSVTIGNNVKSIGKWAFFHCSRLTNIIMPGSVTSIDDFSFCGCISLTSVAIGNNVKLIGSYAFNGCTKLKNITIPDSVTSIGKCAFHRCKNLCKPKGLYFKGFNSDLSCMGKQYNMGVNIGEDSAVICKVGYHYCDNPYSVLDYYGGKIGRDVRFCLVEPYGKIDTDPDVPNKHCCTKIKLVKEFNSYSEMFNYYLKYNS